MVRDTWGRRAIGTFFGTQRKAKRLESLPGKRLAILDCGKRGGHAILKGVARRLQKEHGLVVAYEQKSSAHRMAARALVERLNSEYDAIVYGVVN